MEDDITVQIAHEIAEQQGVDPTELGYTLQDHIETDALEQLANGDVNRWTLSFECPDGTVTVTGNGGIHVDLVGETPVQRGQITVD